MDIPLVRMYKLCFGALPTVELEHGPHKRNTALEWSAKNI